MSTLLDLHVHTALHSPCSHIDPAALIRQGIRAGLDGLVITEHHYQWREAELQRLAGVAGEPNFVLLAGFEYTSAQGDVLIYGLDPAAADEIPPGLPPKDVVEQAHRRGGACIAAHPTRMGFGFDDQIASMPLAGIEVCSVNLREHERRLAMSVASACGFPPIASSDAHRLQDVGRFATLFPDAVRTMDDLCEALRERRFRLPDGCVPGKEAIELG